MEIKRYNGGVINLKDPIEKVFVTKAELKKSLMSENVIEVSIESKKKLPLSLGDKIIHEGETFWLNTPPAVKKEQGFFHYDLIFEGVQYWLRKKILFNTDITGFYNSSEFYLTGTLEKFMGCLINNLEQINEVSFNLGVIEGSDKTTTLNFSNENCLEALHNICQEFNVEFYFSYDIGSNEYYLNVKERIGSSTSIQDFEYGYKNTAYSILKKPLSQEIVTRMYAYGGTDNIPYDYRNNSERLRMPISVGDYIENEVMVENYGVVEEVKFFDDIYPSFKGNVIIDNTPTLTPPNFVILPINTLVGNSLNNSQKISNLTTNNNLSTALASYKKTKKQHSFKCEEMDFDLKAKDENGNHLYLKNGETAKINILTGDLAGYTFEIIDYDHLQKKFYYKGIELDNGMKIPNNTIALKDNDEFTLVDIVMPQSYIDNAEQRLYQRALEEYGNVTKTKVTYTLHLDSLYFQNNSYQYFNVGDSVNVKDITTDILINTRILSIRQDLLEKHSYTLELADSFVRDYYRNVYLALYAQKKDIKKQHAFSALNYLKSVHNAEEGKALLDYKITDLNVSVDNKLGGVKTDFINFTNQSIVASTTLQDNKLNNLKNEITGVITKENQVLDSNLKNFTLANLNGAVFDLKNFVNISKEQAISTSNDFTLTKTNEISKLVNDKVDQRQFLILQAELNNKANNSHTHNASEIVGLNAIGRNYVLNSNIAKSGDLGFITYPLSEDMEDGVYTVQIWYETATFNGAGIGVGNLYSYNGTHLHLFNLDPTLGKHSATFQINKGTNSHLTIYVNASTTIKKIKVERGSTATEWCPAYEDSFFAEQTLSIFTGSEPRTNQSWFDYNMMGTGNGGVMASFSGLEGGYRLEIGGMYNKADGQFYIRTRNGDTNTWNPAQELIHSGNIQWYIANSPSTQHTHSIADVTNLQTALNNKANTSHTHTIAQITNLQTVLNNKANTSHTHTIANITNLQTELNSRIRTTHVANGITSTDLSAWRGATTSTIYLETTSGFPSIGRNNAIVDYINNVTAISVVVTIPNGLTNGQRITLRRYKHFNYTLRFNGVFKVNGNLQDFFEFAPPDRLILGEPYNNASFIWISSINRWVLE